ncbi:hypothetical protein EV363DRAFT_1318218 [Boletus edulis]|nr:hypothetical protein EV363DRAFT_1318218 [Boletus edulis]
MSTPAGIPLLSGSPPPPLGPIQRNCRKCKKEFNIIFNRRHECMHCGYDFCSSCTDYQALLPRRGRARGYDPAPVCGFCIDMLNITALSRAQLRSLPLAKLRRYIDAYNISVRNPVDKNDLVDVIVATRTPQGCLPPSNEDYYRKNSVPSSSTTGSSSSSTNRNPSTRGPPTSNTNSNPRSNRSFPRPDLDTSRRQRPQDVPYGTYTPRATPNTPRSRTTSAPLNPGTTRPTPGQPDISRPTSSAGRQPTPQTTSTTHVPSLSQTTPPLPPPPMSTLVTLPRSFVSALSIGTLKQILWEARVRVPPGVVEKEELVERVWALVEEEKRKDDEALEDVDFDNEDDMEGIGEPGGEEQDVVEMVDPESETRPNHLSVPVMDSGLPSSRPTTPQLSTSPPSSSSSPLHQASKSKPRPHPNLTNAERSGLCVVCQDEDACIAIIDCGHLALCRACSDLVLASSRECPLCRTRIVTEGRLLRIFKT